MRKSTWEVAINGRGISANDIMKKFWNHRGIADPEVFLNPTGFLYPAQEFKYIDDAARTFLMMLRGGFKFLIYADVDTDGCTSAAILYHYLTAHGAEAEVYINHKKDHGVKDDFFETDHGEGIVIVVDSINNDMTQYEKIWAQGKQLIILDHHVPNNVILQNAQALRLVSSAFDYPNPHLSGSGVTWKFVRYIDSILGTNYSDDLVDLAATGIIADVCSVGMDSMENREICNLGFKHIVNVGIRTLVGADEMNADSVAYSIAPFINAANRMNKNESALNIFLTDKSTEAKQLAKDLKKIRDEQRAKANELFEGFDQHIENQIDNACYLFFVDEEVGTLGGLLATKASDKWQRPCCVLHTTPEGYAGSMRAVGVEDFRALANASGVAQCEGHPNSAGIVIQDTNYFNAYINNALKDVEFKPVQHVDVQIDRVQLTPFLISKIRQVNRISGSDFPAITFLIENVKNYTVRQLSQGKHLCIEVPDMKFLQWNFSHWDDVEESGCLSAIGTLDESFFCGKVTQQMLMQDYIFERTPEKQLLW